MMKNVVYTTLAICSCLGVGKLLNYAFEGLPASLYGMIIYCLLLQLGWFIPRKVHQGNQWIIRHMGVCFIPSAVGVINHFELIKTHGYTLVAIIFFTTFLLITLVGILAEKYLTTKSTSTETNKGY
jgi:holin-like protein